MQYRILGRTEIQVSEIGFGAWGIGGEMWKGAEDTESLRALHVAADLGITIIDTALAYGRGHSERLVGKFLKEHNGKITVATKIPPKNRLWPARPGTPLAEAFPADYIISCTERSLRNLDVDTIDLQQLHVWDDAWAARDEWKEAFARLKTDGKVRHVGISINDHQPENALRAAETGLIDVFQVIYNIFDQAPERKLFPYCEEHRIGIIVRVPLDEGALTGSITPETTFPEGDWRNSYFRGERKAEVQRHTDDLKPLVNQEKTTLAELALRFCLQPQAVSTVIPGMRSIGHVEANCAVADGRKLTAGVMAQLRNHAWEKNYYA